MKIKNPYSLDARINMLAHECIEGTFGDGKRRKEALGSMYEIVRRRVNQIMAESKEVAVKEERK